MFIFAPIRWSLRLIELVVFCAIVYLIVNAVQVVMASRVSSDVNAVSPATAIVIFSAPVSGSVPDTDQLARLQQTVALFDAHKASSIIVSGPRPLSGAISTTSIAQSWLASHGVPSSDVRQVIADNNANALTQVRTLLGQSAPVIVVTDAIDVMWTRGVAANAGLKVAMSPPPESKKSFYTEFSPLWLQSSGIALGRVVGYGRIGWAAH